MVPSSSAVQVFWWTAAALLSSSAVQAVEEFPSHISLRAGVLHAPPFASVDKAEDGTYTYRGFQPDMLESLKVFAAQDNVTLELDLSPSPPQYGAALDLVANDCLEVNDDDNTEECSKFDLIVGDYYCNAERSMRVDFTPSWLRTTMSTLKFTDKIDLSQDLTTLTQAEQAKATVCVPDGTYLMKVVMAKHPGAEYIKCPSPEACLEALKAEECCLYADDELLLRYRAALDPSLEVTRESFNSQFLVWPMSNDLSPIVSKLFKKWVYAAVANATLDKLYYTYFQKELCPVGTAGENCELPCDPEHGTADARGVCVCESPRWTGDDCSIEIPENTNKIPPSLKIGAYCMLGANVAVIVGCAIWLYCYRNTTQVTYSQPFFLLLVLLGCLISSSTIIPLAQEDSPTDDTAVPACMMIPWLYSVGFSVTFGSLFAKILRVWLIFSQAAHRKSAGASSSYNRRNPVTFKETLSVIGAVLIVDVAILVAWTLIDPLAWKRTVIRVDNFNSPLESHGFCTSDSWMIFASIIGTLHLLLLGVACWLTYISRNIPTKFSEGKILSIAMFSNLQVVIVAVPVLLVLGADPQSAFFIRSCVIWLNDLVVVTLIFGNLMYNTHMRPAEKDSDDNVRAEIGRAVSLFQSQGGSNRKFSVAGNAASTYQKSEAPPSPSNSGPNASPQKQKQKTQPHKRCSLISSLSLGSAESYSMKGAGNKVTKTVSWGMAYYSEAGEEGSLAALSLVSESDSEEEDDEESQLKVDEESGSRRFSSQPIQGAPKRPPQRGRGSDDSDGDDSEVSIEIGDADPACVGRMKPHPVQGPPKMPPRLMSSVESLDCSFAEEPSTDPNDNEQSAAGNDVEDMSACKPETMAGLLTRISATFGGRSPATSEAEEPTRCKNQGAPRLPPRRGSLLCDDSETDHNTLPRESLAMENLSAMGCPESHHQHVVHPVGSLKNLLMRRSGIDISPGICQNDAKLHKAEEGLLSVGADTSEESADEMCISCHQKHGSSCHHKEEYVEA
ncbi:acid type B receptor subunit 2 [Seminavis robusta]|uniref:Acid type B receptor subunit 2 n=1 Tax=Seminavis robusta TaxID=568900 RepID=A0A9N8DII1_9STRA|nr:acid type B receptor subunit 2 [Seminavis robusta]|eukprot:Sro107_g053750.1 acid type B receptor subunit 2 (1012) ;mRNA; r:18750-22020